jgi:hypothetical protein
MYHVKQSTITLCMLGAASKAIAAPPHLDILGAVTILTENDLRGNQPTSLDEVNS